MYETRCRTHSRKYAHLTVSSTERFLLAAFWAGAYISLTPTPYLMGFILLNGMPWPPPSTNVQAADRPLFPPSWLHACIPKHCCESVTYAHRVLQYLTNI